MMELELPKGRMPLSFNQEDFSFSKLYKCVIVEGQKTMNDVVHAMYAHPLVNSEGGTMLLKDYFVKVLGWSTKIIKRKVGRLEQPLLEVDLMAQELDVSLAHKVMVEACFNIYNELSNNCRNQINFLKKLRNKISHKYGCVGMDITLEIDTLKVVLKDIYEGVGTVLEKDFTDNILEMEKRLTDIRDAQVHQNDIASYEEDVKNFKKDRIHQLISRGRKELEKKYRRFRVLNPCTWMTGEVSNSSVDKFHVDKIFTPLRTEDSRNDIEMKDILNVKKQLYGEESLPPALLFHGLAGCGKSSLCYYLLNDWYLQKKEVLSLSDFDLVLFVNVRTVKSLNLKEYLMQQLIFETTKDFQDPDYILPMLKELDILFIIDGFDEANEIALEVIEEIIAKFSDHRIILTTRPEFHWDAALLLKKHHVDCLSIEICGFNDQNAKEFIEKVFNAVEKNPNKCKKETADFFKYIRERGNVLGSHLRLPLTLALLIYLWRDRPALLNKVTTSTSLYYELFKLGQKKLQERLKCSHEDRRILEVLLLFLGEQAWDLLQSGRINISDEIKQKIENECISKGIAETEFMSAFLMCEIRDDEDTLQRDYAFLHKTQMEYLAAAFLANKVQMSKNFTCVKEVLNEWHRYHQVILFLTGHLAQKHILETHVDDLFELVDQAQVQNINYNFWWKLFVESYSHIMIGNVIAEDKLPIEDWFLDDTHLVAGLRLLIETKVKLKTMRIEIAIGVEPYEIPDFLDIMRKMRHELRNRHNKQNPILLELHFWRHNEYDFRRPSDEFLCTLNPWGHLRNFTGGLGEQVEGKEVLSYCFKLKTIRVRIMTPGALMSFSKSLLKIHKSVRHIRITLALPPTCAPESIPSLHFQGNLEITMENIRDEDIQWFVDIVKRVSGRRACQHIFLLKSEVTFSGIMLLIGKLSGIFQGKFSIDTAIELTHGETAELNKKMQKSYIFINWI